jgi:hypothetical protein
MARYTQQDSSQTLAEGLAEYRALNPQLADLRRMSPEASQFFRCHDVAHVVFGCGTALDDEAVVKIASVFGTTAGFGVLRGYRLHESTEIYRRLRLGEMLNTFVRAFVVVPRTIGRCRRQRARWPWSEHAHHLDRTLADVRREFGITVARAPASDGSPVRGRPG